MYIFAPFTFESFSNLYFTSWLNIIDLYWIWQEQYNEVSPTLLLISHLSLPLTLYNMITILDQNLANSFGPHLGSSTSLPLIVSLVIRKVIFRLYDENPLSPPKKVDCKNVKISWSPSYKTVKMSKYSDHLATKQVGRRVAAKQVNTFLAWFVLKTL